MSVFPLKIISCNRLFFEGNCRSLVIPAMDGEYGILAHHEPLVAAISPGTVRIRPETGELITAIVGMGFVDISPNQVVMLVDTAERPEEIDARLAAEVAQQAQEIMHHRQSQLEYRLAQSALARAMSRLQGKKDYM